MSKKLVKADVDVSSLAQMVERMGNRLGHIWHELDGKPEAQAAITAVWEQVQQLQTMNSNQTALLEASKAAVVEAVKQRNQLVFELRALERDGVEKSQKRLAGVIAVACKMPLPDVERVLAVILGDKTTFEENALDSFLETFAELASRLYVEQTYNSYADGETEEFEAEDFEDDDA
jgi:hypothetical protein